MSFKDRDTHSQSKKNIFSVYNFIKMFSKKKYLISDLFKSVRKIDSEAIMHAYTIVSVTILNSRGHNSKKWQKKNTTFKMVDVERLTPRGVGFGIQK